MAPIGRIRAGIFRTALVATVLAGGLSAMGVEAARAAAPVPCQASAHVDAEWGAGTPWGGQVISVSVQNTAATPSSVWSVSWGLAPGQSLAGSWNVRAFVSDGRLTATSSPSNGVLAPGASTSFGVQLNGTGPAPVPTCFAVVDPPTTTRVVTAADSRTTVTLRSGDTLVVQLGPDYRIPTVTGSVLTPVSITGGYPTGRPLVASYRAVGSGSADVQTATDYPCLHTQPRCAIASLTFTLHVVVQPPPPVAP